MTMPIAEAARRLGVGADWLSRQARAGLVPHVKFGKRRRFTEEHLAEIVRQRQQGVSADPWVRDAKQVARRRRRSA